MSIDDIEAMHAEFKKNAEILTHKIDVLALQAQSPLVLLLSELIADALRNLLVAHMPNPPDKKRAKEMFDGFGPMSTLSARISLCYLFGFIDADIHHNLRVIKSIRNEFAHPSDHVSFATTEVADKVRSLRGKFEGEPKSVFVNHAVDIIEKLRDRYRSAPYFPKKPPG